MRKKRTFGLVALILLAVTGRAPAGEAYFVMVFGSQQIPNHPNFSHSWATFVRITWPGNGPCPKFVTMEAHTISWLPQTGDVRFLALLPECGANFDLHTTMKYVLDNHERISMWGPYQIEPDLYCRALKQIEHLESGAVKYKANDTLHRASHVSNCIHAVSTTVDGTRLRVFFPVWGETASFDILKRMSPWIVDCHRIHSWIGSVLGLDGYPIIYRDWRHPHSGAGGGGIYRALGGERDLGATYGPPH
jgi:hypothetical protein